MPALPPDSYDSLVGKFVVTPHGQMLVERVELQAMRAIGRLADGHIKVIALETILDSEVTEVDWRDLEVVEKYLAGEPIVEDVRLETPRAAELVTCSCECGQKGGCYRLAQGLEVLAGHQTIPAVGCRCRERVCGCMALPLTPYERLQLS